MVRNRAARGVLLLDVCWRARAALILMAAGLVMNFIKDYIAYYNLIP